MGVVFDLIWSLLLCDTILFVFFFFFFFGVGVEYEYSILCSEEVHNYLL